MKLVVFDVWGDYGYFRKPYTSTSTLTYPFPPRTTIAGLISAILGLPKDSYHETFNEENSKIGLRLLNPVDKMNYNFKYIDTSQGFILSDCRKNLHVQVSGELVRNPKYRIYVSLKDEELLTRLFELIKEHKSVYTPYLGESSCIADFKLAYNEIITPEKEYTMDTLIDSIMCKDNCELIIEAGKNFNTISCRSFTNKDNEPLGFQDYVYETRSNQIRIRNGDYYKVKGENIVLY